MRTNVSEQETLGLQVHRSDTPRYSHIERWPDVDSYHKISVIYAGLGPLADLLVEREQWCRFTLGNKTGRRKLPGQSYSGAESPCVLKLCTIPSSTLVCFLSLSQVNPPPRSSLPQGAISTWVCNLFSSTSPSHTEEQAAGRVLWCSLGVTATPCGSCAVFHWKCCYLQRAIKHNTDAHLLWPAPVLMWCALWVMKDRDGAQGDDLWIDSQ